MSASALCGVAFTAHFLLAGSWPAAVGMGACTAAAFVETARRARRLVRVRALRVELSPVQRGAVVEARLSLDPRSALQLASVQLALVCDRFDQPAGTDIGVTERVFTLERRLFDGTRRLGHGERFEAHASFELPPRPEGPSLHTALELRVEVSGEAPIEHREVISLDWSGRR